jgi:hypothetical protein
VSDTKAYTLPTVSRIIPHKGLIKSGVLDRYDYDLVINTSASFFVISESKSLPPHSSRHKELTLAIKRRKGLFCFLVSEV